jgi:hypothetical protein
MYKWIGAVISLFLVWSLSCSSKVFINMPSTKVFISIVLLTLFVHSLAISNSFPVSTSNRTSITRLTPSGTELPSPSILTSSLKDSSSAFNSTIYSSLSSSASISSSLSGGNYSSSNPTPLPSSTSSGTSMFLGSSSTIILSPNSGLVQQYFQALSAQRHQHPLVLTQQLSLP